MNRPGGTADGYASVHTFLRGRFRPLESLESQAIAPQGGFSSSVTRDEFMNNTALPETVSRFLAQMDMKLDALLAAHNEAVLARDFPHTMEVRDLSAAHLVFTSDMPLAPNDYLEVCFSISHPFFSIVSGIGRVLRRRETAGGVLFDFEFIRINEQERESIIRFVFHEERKILRQRLDA